MGYQASKCAECGELFLSMKPEMYDLCEDCEQDAYKELYEAQDIDWHQSEAMGE